MMKIKGINNRRLIMVLSPAKTLDLTPLSKREYLHSAKSVQDGNRNGGEGEWGDVVDAASIIALSKKRGAQRYQTTKVIPGDNQRWMCCREKTEAVVEIMKKKSVGELKQLLNLSASLAAAAHQYWSEFDMQIESNEVSGNLKPAIFTFSGPAFQGLSPQTCNLTTLTNMATNLFVLDPVYGVLRALDGIRPYRLEMGCKGIIHSSGDSTATKNSKKESLASFWKNSVTSFLASELEFSSLQRFSNEAQLDDAKPKTINIKEELSENYCESKNKKNDDEKILVNLASEEYSSSINPSELPSNSIFLNVFFRHEGRIISSYCKRARGLMARYLSERNAHSLKIVSEFDWEGYYCISLNGSMKKGTRGKCNFASQEDHKLWETVDVVGDNVKIVQMTFDRTDIPSVEQTGGKRALRVTTGNRKKRRF